MIIYKLSEYKNNFRYILQIYFNNCKYGFIKKYILI